MDNEDKLLIQEYCYIRTKQEHKAPDVKKAWDQFEHEHIMKNKVSRLKGMSCFCDMRLLLPLSSLW